MPLETVCVPRLGRFNKSTTESESLGSEEIVEWVSDSQVGGKSRQKSRVE